MIPLAKPLIGDEEIEAVSKVLRSGMLSQGPEVEAFEDEFSEYVEGRICVAVNAGTSALHVALLAAGIGPGDEVVVPSFSFAATANAVRLAGATPVFADIKAETFCLDPEAVDAECTSRTAAIMPVHLYGQTADMAPLEAIAKRRGLLLVEDAAQAHCASDRGRPAGSIGTLAAFSFYPTKNMTTGEGGMVVTADESMARHARLLRNQGMDRPYLNEVVGFNLRMTDIAAAIGRVQLRSLLDRTRRRQQIAARYDAALRTVVTPPVADDRTHVYHQYTVRSENRDGLQERLSANQIGSAVYYPVPIHRLPAYDLTIDLPETERACQQALSIPVGPHLSDDEVERVIAAVNE